MNRRSTSARLRGDLDPAPTPELFFAPRVVQPMLQHDRPRASSPRSNGLGRTGLGPRAGMSLIEVMVTMTVLGAAFLMYSGAVVATSRQRTSCYESTIVADAAQRVLEQMRSEDFRTVYALYNENPFDDPAGTGTAPGCRFDIPGLDPWKSSTDTSVGRVHLPAVEVEPRVWQLREDQEQVDLGMPRDLSGDSILDDQDHALDYVQLPVRVTVHWQSRTGPRHLEIDTLLVEFRR